MHLTYLMLNVCILASPSGQLAYISGVDPSSHCVSVMDVATGSVQRVGHGERDGAPVWSPNGEWLAFTASAPNGLGVYGVRSDGTDKRLISKEHRWSTTPVWAPDREPLRLAYSSGEIYVYDFGSQTETSWSGTSEMIQSPVWLRSSPLLSSIPQAKESMTEAEAARWQDYTFDPVTSLLAVGLEAVEGSLKSGLCIATPKRTLPIPVSLTKADRLRGLCSPSVSPDGSQIAFDAADGSNRDIYLMSRQGTVNITDHPSSDWNAVWSPDGRSLAFESFRGGQRGIYRVDIETRKTVPITTDEESQNWAPAWSPDGNWIAFVSTRYGNPEILIADRDGKQVQRMTNNTIEEYAPRWRPEVGE